MVRGRPLFRGHYQPHLPSDLGFYDLRLHDARLAQAQLAAVHGIEGFCYWHYQSYSPGDVLNHVRWLIGAFSDSRYIRVANRPLFLVYRPRDLPDSKRTTDVFRIECVRQGLPEPYLLGVDAHCPGVDCRTLGFDGTLVFEPQLGALPEFRSDHASFAKLRQNMGRGVLSCGSRSMTTQWPGPGISPFTPASSWVGTTLPVGARTAL